MDFLPDLIIGQLRITHGRIRAVGKKYIDQIIFRIIPDTVSYTHLRAHETVLDLVCRLLLEKKKNLYTSTSSYSNTLINITNYYTHSY